MTLDDYFFDEYNLILLDSELNEIRELARQEIDLPDEQEIKEYVNKEYQESCASDQDAPDLYALGVEVGIKWALNKVRNPYPKQINP
jgi:hypothetical protein